MTTAHHNVLLEGPPHATQVAIGLMQPHLKEPIVRRRPGETLELGPDRRGTLIVEDVTALSADEQMTLRGWLCEARPGVQIVSTTSISLYSLVERGLFDAPLYYRLNVMLLRVNPSRTIPHQLNMADPER